MLSRDVNDGNVLSVARAIFPRFWLTRRRTAHKHVCGRSKLLAMAHRNTGIKLVQKDAALVQNTRIGPAAETLLRMTINQLRSHMEVFYEHGTLPDLLLLCAAFDCVERKRLDWSPERAWLIDSLLTICDR